MSASATFDHVDYDQLDSAKLAFIAASRQTLTFARDFGFVADPTLGASANIFSLSLKPFIEQGLSEIQVTLLPEGLGTADDARPADLSTSEQRCRNRWDANNFGRDVSAVSKSGKSIHKIIYEGFS